MKKVSLILVALLLLASVSLTAQSKWTNWGEGILYPFIKVGDAAAEAGWGPSWMGPGGAYQEWGFAYDGESYGFYGVFKFDQGFFGGPLANWAAWYNFADLVKLSMGAPKVSDYRFTSKVEGFGYTRIADGDNGLVLQVTPIAGLSLGAAMYVEVGPADLDLGQNFGVAASYTLPDIATFAATYRSDVDILHIGASITALEGIGLVAAYQATLEPDLAHLAFLSVSMKLGPVAVAADGAISYDTDFQFGAVVNGEFALTDMWELGASVGYDTEAVIVGSGEGTPAPGFSLFPYVKANFPNDSYVKAGFIFASGNDLNANQVVLAVPILYVVSF